MSRRTGRSRRLTVGDAVYRWSLGGRLRLDPGTERRPTHRLTLRRDGAPGRVVIAFQAGPGRLVPDGYLPFGTVATDRSHLNLHQPGTVRALLAEALARGWQPEQPRQLLLDGWPLLDAVAPHRTDRPD